MESKENYSSEEIRTALDLWYSDDTKDFALLEELGELIVKHNVIVANDLLIAIAREYPQSYAVVVLAALYERRKGSFE
jgi:hypothetical protein